MHFTQSLKQQKSTTKGPSNLIKLIDAKDYNEQIEPE
jgi:hypothetical protein